VVSKVYHPCSTAANALRQETRGPKRWSHSWLRLTHVELPVVGSREELLLNLAISLVVSADAGKRSRCCYPPSGLRLSSSSMMRLQQRFATGEMGSGRDPQDRMSALGQKQTSRHLQPMSALPPKADIHRGELGVRFVKADTASLNRSPRSRDVSRIFIPAKMKGCNAFPAKRCSGAANKAEAINAECNPLVRNELFAALFLGILQAT